MSPEGPGGHTCAGSFYRISGLAQQENRDRRQRGLEEAPMSHAEAVIVVSTWPAGEDPGPAASTLVEERLAACVNILPKARSIYRWQEKIEDAGEWVLLVKSRRDLFAALGAEIQKLHTYEVPEVIAIPIVDGSEAYLAWLDGQIQIDQDRSPERPRSKCVR
jgi:periplasmic divalent cation tolerance protein